MSSFTTRVKLPLTPNQPIAQRPQPKPQSLEEQFVNRLCGKDVSVQLESRTIVGKLVWTSRYSLCVLENEKPTMVMKHAILTLA